MDNQFLIRALAAHSALYDAEARWNPLAFLKRANDAHCIIESYAYGTLDIKTDVHGNAFFSRKAVEPNLEAATAKEQPIKATHDEGKSTIRRMIRDTSSNEAGNIHLLINSGIVTPGEIRDIMGLPPIKAA